MSDRKRAAPATLRSGVMTTHSGPEQRLRGQYIKAVFGDPYTPHRSLSEIARQTTNLEDFLIVRCALATLIGGDIPRGATELDVFVTAAAEVENGVEVVKLSLNSPYEIVLGLAGASALLLTAANRAINVFNNFQDARIKKAVAERDVERYGAERDAYQIIREELRKGPKRDSHSEARATEFESRQVPNQLVRERMNGAVQALAQLQSLRVVEDPSEIDQH